MQWRAPEPLRETPTARMGRATRRRDHGEEPRRDTSSGYRDEEGLQYFTEFLQETPPPVYNIMSIPDSFSTASSEDDSWTKVFRTISRRRRKGRRKHHPPVIRLPDSAVAATTTGGHRHIAISIPIEHSYLGPADDSQIPISESIDAEAAQETGPEQSIHPRFAPPQSRSAEPGAMNFLQPVAEDRESSPVPISPSPPSSPMQPVPARRYHHSKDSAYSFSSGEPSSPKRSTRPKTPPDATKFGFTQPAIEERTAPEPATRRKPQPIVVVPDMTPILSSRTRRAVATNSQEGNNPTTKPGTESPFHISNADFPLPERRGSRRAAPPQESSQTIAGMINSWMAQKSAEEPKYTYGRKPSYDRNPEFRFARGSIAESMMSTTSEPRVLDALAAKAYQNAPIVIRPPSQHTTKSSMTQASSDSPPKATAVVNRSGEPAIPEDDTVQKSFSHEDHMQQPKQKDIKITEQDNTMRRPSVAIHLLHDGSVQIWPESPGLPHFSDMESSYTSLRPSHFPKPSPPTPRIVGGIFPETPEHSPTHVPTPSKIALSDSLVISKDSSSSPFSGSPTFSYEPLSYYRPTEKRAEPDVEDTPKTLYATQTQAKEQKTAERLEQQDLAKRHERLKETRQRDLEKRLHRLERNGEIWLRSIIPMMESINRMLEQSRQESRQSHPAHSSLPVKTYRALRSSLDQLSSRSGGIRSSQPVGSQTRLKRRPARPDLSGTTRVPQAMPLPSSSSSSLSSITQSGVHDDNPPIPGSLLSSPLDEFEPVDLSHRKAGQHHLADISKDASASSSDISSISHNGNAAELETLELLLRDYQGEERFGMGDFGSTGGNGVWQTKDAGGEDEAEESKRAPRTRWDVQEQSTQTRTGKFREWGTQTQVWIVRNAGTQTRDENARWQVN